MTVANEILFISIEYFIDADEFITLSGKSKKTRRNREVLWRKPMNQKP